MSAAKEFRRIFGKASLKSIYLEKIHDSNAIGLDRVAPSSLKKLLGTEISLINEKVLDGRYRFTAYKEKLISKGAASFPRVISIPTARDRVTLRALAVLLTRVFPEAVTKIPQIKIDSLSKELDSGKYGEFVKIDLRQFYPSVPHDSLVKRLRTRIRKPQVIDLIEKAIKTPTVAEQKGGRGAQPNNIGVPQGLSISNVLAEIFLIEFDKEITEINGIFYERYVDDILILCPIGRSKKLVTEICSRLEALGLNPHHLDVEGSKTKCGKLDSDFDFLGYSVQGRRLNVRKQSIHKFEGSLAGICTAYRHRLKMARSVEDKQRAIDVCQWRLNLRITGCIFDGKRLGWVFYFSQINETTPLRGIDNTVQRLIQRFSLEGVIKPKRLLKTFYEGRRVDVEDHKYIPNFDTMDAKEQRQILATLLGENRIKGVPDRRISELFKMRISAAVRELEEDITATS